MGSRYLTDLAEVCRRTGYPVIEVDGWQTRARGSGGYAAGLPSHVVCHHTASGPSSDGWPDVNYLCFGDEDAPLSNLYLARIGEIYVCAGGATNTNGSGSDPCGFTPDDSMNSHAIGIEAGNNGTGEPWPVVQQDAYLRLVGELCAFYSIPPARGHSHAEWAPDRKVDPAGPSRWATSGTWNMDSFRGDLTAPPIPTPSPPVPLERLTTMLHIVAPGRGQTLLGPMFRHFAHTDDEAIIFDRAYGAAVQLSDYDYDVLCDAVFVNDPPKGQGGDY